jgi:hypothetical protein
MGKYLVVLYLLEEQRDLFSVFPSAYSCIIASRCMEASLVRDKALCPMCRSAVVAAELVEAPPEDDAAPPGVGPAAAAGGVAPSAKVAFYSSTSPGLQTS